MSNYNLRRHGDYADMPRELAWFIMTIKEIGLPAVMIGALLYFMHITLEKTNTILNTVAVHMEHLDDNDRSILEYQHEILRKFN